MKFEDLKSELFIHPKNTTNIRHHLKYLGMKDYLSEPPCIVQAYGLYGVLVYGEKYIYENDLIVGSIRGILGENILISELDKVWSEKIVNSVGSRNFTTNYDHYAPDYETFLKDGISGTLKKIEHSKTKNNTQEQLDFLVSCEISIKAFKKMIEQYGDEAKKRFGECEIFIRCKKISENPPKTFLEALQFVWFTHLVSCLEGRFAMALGRLDQYLYPYYKNITKQEALIALQSMFIKIYEHRYCIGDDVVNIAIGGVIGDGSGGVNELSYLILEAVKNCNIPGPNLSARIYKDIPDKFLDECLQSIGTGLGYPALMNDEVNIKALLKQGYSLEDCRNYCMVGCIENFIAGKQPPWSDGRYNSPKYLELAINNGICTKTGKQLGPITGEDFNTMEEFLTALVTQMQFGALMYCIEFNNNNRRLNPKQYPQPFLSCITNDCINKALDINDGGTIYKSAHGVGCMGIATVADSLAAIEKNVFDDKTISFGELKRALYANFDGYDEIYKLLIDTPKYGNNIEMVDKYAIWYIDCHSDIFSIYNTPDGGMFYIGIASNTQNINAGLSVGATPDGRKDKEALSDAASPMHGMDKKGPTSVILSITKPDYTKAACGTVVNQKFEPNVFTNQIKRKKLLTLIKTYFNRGGQEIQINAVSKEILIDAMNAPKKYDSLIVRVSGFSAYYTKLEKAVQEDILMRTEHE